jgi:hypothetical protein
LLTLASRVHTGQQLLPLQPYCTSSSHQNDLNN